MSIRDCINSAVSQGELTLEEGQQIQKRFDALFARMGGPRARQQLAAELAAEGKEKKRRALLTETRRKVLVSAVLTHKNASGQADPAEALKLMLEHHGQAKFQDVEHHRLALLGMVHAEMSEILETFRKGAITGDLRRRGYTVKAGMTNVVRELFGEDSGDAAAKAMASAWSDVAEKLRQRFNAAGGAVAKLGSWGLPQHHDPLALLNVGSERWIAEITPLLDREKMVSPLTGERLTDRELRDALADVYMKISTDGWASREPSGQSAGRGALFGRYQDHRFLHFKDAASYLKYQRDFGGGDPYDAMMGHLSTMTRDIAMMEILGPSPEAMRTYLKQLVERHAAVSVPVQGLVDRLAVRLEGLRRGSDPGLNEDIERLSDAVSVAQRAFEKERGRKRPKADRLKAADEALSAAMDAYGARLFVMDDELRQVGEQLAGARAARNYLVPPPGRNPLDRVRKAVKVSDDMWAVLTGTANVPVDSRIANTLASARNLVSASALGSAAISAMSDVAFQTYTRKFVGLHRAGMTSVVGETVAMLQRGTRMEAVRAGLILDSAVHVMHQQARYTGALNSRSMTGFVADRSLGLSGLSAQTQAGKHAFGMGFQAEMGSRAGLAFDALDEPLRNTLTRHGLSAADWDTMRSSTLYEPQPGAVFLRPNEIADRALAERYLAMILRETRFAVPEATVTSQALMIHGAPGTLMGEVSRNFAQFKMFGIAVTMLHGGRVAREFAAGNYKGGALYAGGLLMTATLLGALALQIKELIQGRDPRNMLDEKFWGAAVMQSGGLGIYGDFLFSGVNRLGGGLTSTIAGPLVGRLDGLRNSTVGNIFKQADDKSRSNPGRDAVKLIKDWTPGGSLWYARLAYERLVLDRMQEMLDPDAHQAWRRRQQMQRRDYGNGYWWAPGVSGPDRPADLGALLTRR